MLQQPSKEKTKAKQRIPRQPAMEVITSLELPAELTEIKGGKN